MHKQDIDIGRDFTPGWSDSVSSIEDDAGIAAANRTLARELHDTVAQPLTSLLTSIACVEHLPRQGGQTQGSPIEDNIGLWKELAQEALDSLRRALAGISAHPYSQSALPDALMRILEPQLRSRGVRLLVEQHDWPVDLPGDWNAHLYLLIREALTNVEKHAHATMVIVVLRADMEMLAISVTDNGIGFSPDDLLFAHSPAQCGSGLGISGMEDRVRMLGGNLEVMTAPGCGVRLEIRVPNPGCVREESYSHARAEESYRHAVHVDRRHRVQ